MPWKTQVKLALTDASGVYEFEPPDRNLPNMPKSNILNQLLVRKGTQW